MKVVHQVQIISGLMLQRNSNNKKQHLRGDISTKWRLANKQLQKGLPKWRDRIIIFITHPTELTIKTCRSDPRWDSPANGTDMWCIRDETVCVWNCMCLKLCMHLAQNLLKSAKMGLEIKAGKDSMCNEYMTWVYSDAQSNAQFYPSRPFPVSPELTRQIDVCKRHRE